MIEYISQYLFIQLVYIFVVGQRNKVDQKLVEEELVKRMEEYNKSLEMLVLLKQCEVHKVIP